MSHQVCWELLWRHHRANASRWAPSCHGEGARHLQIGPMAPALPGLRSRLHQKTGWELVWVEGEVDDPDFFSFLANRIFPVNSALRPERQLFGAVEPDLWHEAFGHLPFLCSPPISRLYEWFGTVGVRAHRTGKEIFRQLRNLYWFSLEYGLIRENGATRVIGAGLLASPLGLERLSRGHVRVRPWRTRAVLKENYDPHHFQPTLYRTGSLESLRRELEHWERKNLGKP